MSERKVLLSGFYDAEKRAPQVLNILEETLRQFQNVDFTKDPQRDFHQKKEASIPEYNGKDIQGLKREVGEHPVNAAHSSNQCRTFEEPCKNVIGSTEENESAEYSASSGLSFKQSEILTKCKAMEAQLSSGHVRAGAISKRIILETIERARMAVKYVEEVDEDLNELIEQHNFVIN